MLNTAAVKAARPRVRAYKLADSGGLHLFVAPTGLKSFRLRFRLGGHEQVLTIGSYPEVGLDAARVRAEAARAQLARGDDPRAQPSAPSTFEAAARAWLELQAESWTPIHAADVVASLERDVLPAIGAAQLGAIAPAEVLELLRTVERRGARETARRLRQRVSAVFELAIGEGWCSSNPAEHAGRGLRAPAPARRQPAVTSIEDARALLAEVDDLSRAPVAKRASTFLALTAVRWAAVRGARWTEIEDVDGAAPMWRVPAARMKLTAARKTDAAHDHLVPLSPAAVGLLREAQRSRPDQMSELIFPGRGAAMLGEDAIGDLYERTSFAGRHVPHGWRATFSTVMNERRPADRAAIDRALGHVLKADDGKVAKVEAAYNRATHLDLRRELLEEWALLFAPRHLVLGCPN